MATNILRMTQLAVYLVISSQLVFYMYILSDALKQVSIENFAELRRAIDLGYGHRFKVIYYAGLALTSATLISYIREPKSLVFITSAIALVCLITDIAIAMKGSVPINALFSTYTKGNTSHDWIALRFEWLRLMSIRGIFISIGVVSQLVGVMWSKFS